MAKSAKYYDVDDFNNYKRKQGKCVPPRTNVLAAASYIQALFDAKKFTCGFMGGLAMLCLGYRREMPDLHVAYDDKDFERLKAKLESDQRIRLPTGVNPLLPFKVLVWTGPEYKDHGCAASASIELDLVPSGSCNTPAPGALAKNLVMLALRTSDGQQRAFKCLNIQFLMATMLSYCKARDLSWDPRKDVLYLCKNESAEVQRIRAQLNAKEVKEMFLGTSLFSRLHKEDQHLCYRLLLDTDPPPTMAITPPAPMASTSNPDSPNFTQQKGDTRTPRSRYRNASGQRSSSSGTMDHGATDLARPQSMEHLQDPRQLCHIVGVQCVNAGKPQPVSAASAARRARKSMSDLMSSNDTSPASYAKLGEVNKGKIDQQQYGAPHVSNVTNQATLTGSYQKCTSSQLEYGAAFQPAHLKARRGTGDSNQGFSLGQQTLANRSDSTRTDSVGTPTQGIQSQKGSLHVVSPEGEEVPRQQYFEDENAQSRGTLHLVGHEGLYGAPETAQHLPQPQTQHQRHQSAPPPQTEPAFVFELDATVPSKSAFIAELPADSIAPSPAGQRDARCQGLPRSQKGIKLSNPSMISAPFGVGFLPASLVAGGPGTRRQSQSHYDSLEESQPDFSMCQTNVYRYSSYVFPQSASFEALHLPSEETTPSTYQAYCPSAVSDNRHELDCLGPVISSRHKRDASNDSTASHDSAKLAKEYQDLLNFEEGYGGR